MRCQMEIEFLILLHSPALKMFSFGARHPPKQELLQKIFSALDDSTLKMVSRRSNIVASLTMIVSIGLTNFERNSDRGREELRKGMALGERGRGKLRKGQREWKKGMAMGARGRGKLRNGHRGMGNAEEQ